MYCSGTGIVGDGLSEANTDRNLGDRRDMPSRQDTDPSLGGHWAYMVLDNKRPDTPLPTVRKLAPMASDRSSDAVSDRMVRRPRQNRGAMSRPVKHPKPIRPSTDLVKCEFCNMAVHAAHSAEHKYKVHGVGNRQRRRVAKLPELVSSREMSGSASSLSGIARAGKRGLRLIPCPNCRSSVREDRLPNHLLRVHGLNAGTESAPIAGLSSSLPASGRGGSKVVRATDRALAKGKGNVGTGDEGENDHSTEVENYREERRLDGSRDYWQIREEGRFGSHPSFDDCDDESAP